VTNKCDLPKMLEDEDVQRIAAGRPCLRVSALTGEGLDSLEEAIEAMVLGEEGRGFSGVCPRHAAGEGGTQAVGGPLLNWDGLGARRVGAAGDEA